MIRRPCRICGKAILVGDEMGGGKVALDAQPSPGGRAVLSHSGRRVVLLAPGQHPAPDEPAYGLHADTCVGTTRGQA